VFFAFLYLTSGQPCGASTCYTSIQSCNSLGGNSTDVCPCFNSALSGSNCRCDEIAGLVAVTCFSRGLIDRVLDQRPSVDMLTCSSCTSPPGSRNWPSACTLAMVNFVKRVFPIGLTPGARLDLAIRDLCPALGDFYDDFANCGIPGISAGQLNSYVCANDPKYLICDCRNGRVSTLGRDIVSYFRAFSNDINVVINRIGNITVSLDIARTYNCNDRVIFQYTGTFDKPGIRAAIANYLGIAQTRIRIQIGSIDGPTPSTCTAIEVGIAGKRAIEDTEQNSFTLQVTNSAFSVASQIALLLIAIFLLL